MPNPIAGFVRISVPNGFSERNGDGRYYPWEDTDVSAATYSIPDTGVLPALATIEYIVFYATGYSTDHGLASGFAAIVEDHTVWWKDTPSWSGGFISSQTVGSLDAASPTTNSNGWLNYNNSADYTAGINQILTRAAFFNQVFGIGTHWHSSVTQIPLQPPVLGVTAVVTEIYVDVYYSLPGGSPIIPPPSIPPPTPPQPIPCCPPQPPNPPCPCLPGPAGRNGTNGLPGAPGGPGGPGPRGPGGSSGTGGTGPGGPGGPGGTSIGPIGGGGSGGSGHNPGGILWNTAACTNTGGVPLSYATVLPTETFINGLESQFWFEIAFPGLTTSSSFSQAAFPAGPFPSGAFPAPTPGAPMPPAGPAAPIVLPGGFSGSGGSIFGFGTQTRGAYGAGTDPDILRVTNVNDSGAGSLRQAAQVATGPRVVIFETSGTIDLLSDIVITDPYITIAGQTAPSPGITLKGAQNRSTQGGLLSIYTHDVIVQHLRIRPGDGEGTMTPIPQTAANDALLLYNPLGQSPHSIVIDHCSISWASGKNCNMGGNAQGVTLWRCIISEALYHAQNVIISANQPSSLGMLIAGDVHGLTMAQSLMAHCSDRNPETHEGNVVQWINNVIYDWGKDGGLPNTNSYQWATFIGFAGSGNERIDVVGNKYISGPPGVLGHPFTPLYAVGVWQNTGGGLQLFTAQNLIDDAQEPVTDFYLKPGLIDPRQSFSAVPSPSYTVVNPADVEDLVLSKSGARPLDRDSVDTRIVSEVITRTGDVIFSQDDVGGWPVLAVNTRALTTPANPHVVAANGFTNLQNWLQDYAVAVEG